MQKRKEDEKCVDRERNDATKKKNTRVMMKKRKGDEKRGRMKKKDEKQETRHFSETCKSCAHGKCGARRVGRSTRTVKRVGYGVSTGGREKGGEGGAPWMCVRRSVAYMNEYLLGLPTFFFFFSSFACN